MSAVRKVYDHTERTIRFEVAGQQPIDQNDKPPFDPKQVAISVINGDCKSVVVFGQQYKADGKLGKLNASRAFWSGEEAPHWLSQILVDLEIPLWPSRRLA